MAFVVAHHTDIGIKKKTNQDALLIKTAQTPHGEVGLFVICDGMGGLSYGELASATVVRGLSDWFDGDLPKLLEEIATSQNQPWPPMQTNTNYRPDDTYIPIARSLETCIHELNEKILAYGNSKNAKMGTTVTALLIIYQQYFIAQIGDSRAYRFNNNNQLIQLTKDQTLVAREVARGNITPEQAKHHPQRNVLFQCVGAQNNIEVDMTRGWLEPNEFFILCTDGLYRRITEEEMVAVFLPVSNALFGKMGQLNEFGSGSLTGSYPAYGTLNATDQADPDETTVLSGPALADDRPNSTMTPWPTTGSQLQEKAINIVELVKGRGETDNISIITIGVTQK